MSTREKIFGVNPKNLESKERRAAIYGAIMDNNPFLTEEEIQRSFLKAEELGIVNNFDFYKWLGDSNYRRATSDYYNLIKGTWNIFDIVDRLPHFNAIF